MLSAEDQVEPECEQDLAETDDGHGRGWALREGLRDAELAERGGEANAHQ